MTWQKEKVRQAESFKLEDEAENITFLISVMQKPSQNKLMVCSHE